MPAGTTDRADLARACPCGHGDDRGDGRAGVRDERLLTVDHPLVTIERRCRTGAARIAARVGLGETEGAEPPARAQIRQPLLALVLGAELKDRVGPQADARLDGDPHRLIDASQLLECDAERREVGAAAAVLGWEREAEEAEVAHRDDRVDGEGVRAVPLLRMRRDLSLGELADDLAEGLLFVAQLEVHLDVRP